MKKHLAIIFLLFTITTLFPITGCSANTNNPNAIVRIRVIDEEGNPIPGVKADICNIFDMDSTPGLTDENGMFSVHLYDIYDISGVFTKNGYYKSSGDFWKAPEWGKVPPANTNFPIIMKRIIEPVPMRQKKIEIGSLPVGEPIGFDFEVGDLVFPHGKGKVADFIMKTRSDFLSEEDHEVYAELEFPGEQTGIQSFSYWTKESPSHPVKSELMPPSPVAPEFGYTNILERFSKCAPPSEWNRTRPPTHYAYNKKTWSGSIVENRKWIFRTRTVLDDNGKIIAANYGWTTTEIGVWPEPNSEAKLFGIRFTYYYNPDPHSRSLEPKEIADRQNRD